MTLFSQQLCRCLVLMLALFAAIVLDVDAAVAQGASCGRLSTQLQQLDRNSSFSRLGGNQNQLRRLQRELQRNESAYVRTGCNDLAKRGQQLPRDCRNLASQIIDGREQVASLNAAASTGEAVAQQREAILQEMARFGCGGQPREQQRRGNILDQIFSALTGSEYSDGSIVEDDSWGYSSGYNTIRTVCVRKSDGYYWPISYSTVSDYLYDDLQSCQAQCPLQEVDLYYYSNPGQEAEEMVNMNGEAYMALPSAFRYRQTFDPAISCKAPIAGAQVQTIAGEGGFSTASLGYDSGISVPLPRRDPRRPEGMVVAAASGPVTYVDAVHVPLPRRRPPGPGEPVPPPVTTAKPAEAPASRVVEIAGRTVRVVGPDTPYARLGAEAP